MSAQAPTGPSTGQELAEAAFRAAARAIDPEGEGPAPEDADAGVARAWICVHAVRGQPRWIAAAEDAAEAALRRGVPDEQVPRWVLTCTTGWVQRAIGPFRRVAESLLPRLPAGEQGVAARLGWWRITGDPAQLQQALDALPPSGGPPDALRLAWHATADDALRRRAIAALGLDPPAAIPSPHALAALAVGCWPLAADLLDLEAEAFAEPLTAWGERPPAPADAVLASAALALPPLRARVQWWLASELREGPMAEAATFPWPALRLRFERLPRLEQLRVTARVGAAAEDTLYDLGVVAGWFDELVKGVDRGALVEGVGSGRRRGGLGGR